MFKILYLGGDWKCLFPVVIDETTKSRKNRLRRHADNKTTVKITEIIRKRTSQNTKTEKKRQPECFSESFPTNWNCN